MRKIFVILSVVLIFGHAAWGYDVCAPTISATDVGYTTVAPVAGDGIYIGYWAVGSNCTGHSTTAEDVVGLCTSVVAGGTAFCGIDYWNSNNDLAEASASTGSGCWCRRTHVLRDGAVADSIGQAVLIGDTNDNTTTCRNTCAQMCAASVATNENGMRHAIMLLDSF